MGDEASVFYRIMYASTGGRRLHGWVHHVMRPWDSLEFGVGHFGDFGGGGVVGDVLE